MFIEELVVNEIEALNKGDVEAVCSYYTDDCIFIDISNAGEPAIGKAAFEQAMKGYYESFPDLHVDIQRVFSNHEGNAAVAQYTLSGTHKGKMGDTDPTNKEFEVLAISVYELRGDKFSKEIFYWDSASMLKQLGIS